MPQHKIYGAQQAIAFLAGCQIHVHQKIEKELKK